MCKGTLHFSGLLELIIVALNLNVDSQTRNVLVNLGVTDACSLRFDLFFHNSIGQILNTLYNFF